MDSNKVTECRIYKTFGVCVDGSTCVYSHGTQPVFSRKAFFTVALDNPQTYGAVAFHPLEGCPSSKQKYYIPRNGEWYNSGAALGDIVELQISEKQHKSGLCFSRITKILLPVNSIKMQSGGIPCFTHITYGDCRGGLQCSMIHELDCVLDQHFHVATVLATPAPSSGGHCELQVSQLCENGDMVKKRYYLPNDQEWFTMKVSEGNLVIVQKSDRTMFDRIAGMLHYGKVVAVLHKSQGLADVSIPLQHRIRHGFIIEKQNVPSPSFANSLSTCPNCPIDKQCKRIGLHVAAVALGSGLTMISDDFHFVPFHRANAGNRTSNNAFNPNLTRLALSVYRHSSCDSVEGPMITPLNISPKQIFTFREGSLQSDSAPYFDSLWTVFGTSSLIEDAARTSIAHLMVDFPETWKYRYLVRQMKVYFNKQVMAFLQSKDERFVLVKNIVSKEGLPTEETIVPAKSIDRVKTAWRLWSEDEKKISLAILLGTAKRGASTFWRDHYSKNWYPEEVVSTKQFSDDKLMVSTLPTVKTTDLVNQQIVLSMIISPLISLYTKNEISGIIVRRHPTPTILKTVVRQLTGSTVNLQFCGIYGRKNGNRKTTLRNLFPGQMFLSSDDENEHVSCISVLLKGLTSDEYCNTVMVRLPGMNLSALAECVIDPSVGTNETEKMIADLVTVDYDKPTPYELQGQDTRITLQCGVQLQLQVSMEKEVGGKVVYRLRLLRIGKDCHLCLVHLNSPFPAFGGFHTELISEKMLSEMKEQISEGVLECQVLQGINIEWQDHYFSGGRFSAPISSITAGNLLCIRKEIADGQRQGLYVWTCHAVVADVSENDVKFLVCSLGQDQYPDILLEGDNHFVVEVMYITSESC